MPCVPSELEGSALLALVRILPDEVTNPPEERDHQKYGADSGENHCIDEHGLPPVVPVCLGWLHVISTSGGKIDLDQWLESRRDQALGNTDPGQEIGGVRGAKHSLAAVPDTQTAGVSALLGFALGLLPALAQRQYLLEHLAHLVEALVVEVVDTLVALGGEIDQLVVIAHSGNRIRRKVRFRRGAQVWRVFAT